MPIVLPAVPDVIKMEVQGTVGGNPWANILHFLYSGGPPSNADLDTLCTDLHTAWALAWHTYSHDQWALSSVRAIDLSSSSGAVGLHSATVLGTGVNHNVSAASCVLVKHLIARRYRGGHPRTYIAGIDASHLTNPTSWDPTYVGFWNTNWAAMIAGILGTTIDTTTIAEYVNVSYFDKATVPVPPHVRVAPVVDNISGSSVEQNVATQRRRQGR